MSEGKSDLDSIKSFYDEVYYKNAGIHPHKISGHYRRLATRVGINSKHKVLDVACGTGSWLSAVSERGAGIAGIDLSDRAISICKEHFPDAEFYSGPAEQLPFEDNKFNYVTCLGSLEHFIDPVGSIKEMVRVSKPDAQFILLVPNKDFLTRRLGLYGGTHQNAAKEEVRTLEEWKKIFEEGGLDVEERWKDLHMLHKGWLLQEGWLKMPLRLIQAVTLTIWPLKWQYQVYHLCKTEESVSRN